MQLHHWYLKEVGLIGAYTVVLRIREMTGTWKLEKAPPGVIDQLESRRSIIEKEAEGDFMWADPIHAHIFAHKALYRRVNHDGFRTLT